MLTIYTLTQSFTICPGDTIKVGNFFKYTTSGNYNVIYQYNDGVRCDTTISTHLTVLPVNSFAQSITICLGQSLTIGTHNYTASGTYNDTLTSYQGCDSIVTTQLTKLTDASVTISQSLTICAGQSVIVGNHIYSVNGNYTDILTTHKGCDSTVNTNLNILPPNDSACKCFVHYTTDYDSLQNSFTLIVDSTTSASANSYHWDFGDGNKSTLPTPTHVYTIDTVYNVCLKIKTGSNDSCTYCNIIGKDYLGHIYRTSGFTINVINSNLTGISSIPSNENNIIVYPNPFTSQTTILFTKEMKNTTIKIVDILGKEIKAINFTGKQLIIEKGTMKEGVYFVQVIDSYKNVMNSKIIIQ